MNEHKTHLSTDQRHILEGLEDLKKDLQQTKNELKNVVNTAGNLAFENKLAELEVKSQRHLIVDLIFLVLIERFFFFGSCYFRW